MAKKKNRKAFGSSETFNSDENTLRTYLKEINRIPLLSKERELEIANKAAEGSDTARNKLVTSNLRFVVSVAKKYQGKGMPIQDLISEGNIGLMNAVKNFKPELGYRFITYAVWWIRQAIIKAIHEKGRMIRLPSNKTNQLMRIEKTRQIIQNEPGRMSNAELREAAEFLDISPEKTEELMKINQEVASLDEPLSREENSLALKDVIEDEFSNSPLEQATNTVLKDDLNSALDKLGEKAAMVLRCRFGLTEAGPMTLKEIGDRCNLSRERVRQIEKRALGQLQHSSCQHYLDNSYTA